MMRKLLGCLMFLAMCVHADEPLRRVSVPQEVLPMLLEQGADRVMMSVAEYDRLWNLADAIRKTEPVGLPKSVPPMQLDVRAELEADHVRVKVSAVLEGVHSGWNMIELPFENVFWTSATLDQQPAELAGEPGGMIQVFFEGTERQVLKLEGVTGLTLNKNRQQMRFRVPQVPGAVHLQMLKETEMTGMTTASLLEEDGYKTFKVLPEAGWVDAAFSLNRLYRPDPRQLSLRLIQTTALSLSDQEVHISAQVLVNHQPTETLTFTLPAGLTVQSVNAFPAADWDLTSGETLQQIHVRFPKEVIGNVTVDMVALGERDGAEVWSPSDITLVDSTRVWRYHAVHLMDPLRLRELEYGSATPLPPYAGLMTKYPEGTVFAWSPASAGELPQITLREREGSVEGFASLMLHVGDTEQSLKGEVTLRPKGEGLFSSRFTLPAAWDLTSLSLSTGETLSFERYEVEGAMQMLRVDFPAMAPPQRPISYRFSASYTPEGWFEAQKEKRVSFPAFALPGVDRLTGALAAEAEEGHRLQVVNLEGLTPLDDRTRSLLQFQTGDQVAGYRFETAEVRLELLLETLEPELRVEAYSFFTLGANRMKLRYEWILENRRAPIQDFSFSLPIILPRGVTPVLKGMAQQGEVIREPDGNGGERWTVPLTGRPGSRLHLVLASEITFDVHKTFLLPLPRQSETHLQSGFFAVEGLADLSVTLENAPREVDLGELSDADYRPGVRLLGCYAYTGLPPEVKMSFEPQPLLDSPKTRLRRLQLDSRLSVTGEAQTQAIFTLEQPPAFLSLRLPEDAVCWGVEVNQLTVEPRKGKQGEWLIPVQGNAGKGNTLVQVIYSSEVQGPGLGNRQRMQAPTLAVYAGEQVAAALAPVETTWVLFPPEGVDMMDSKGSAMFNQPIQQRLAAVEAAKGLATLAGGVRTPMEWYQTLFGNMLKSSRMYESSNRKDIENTAYENADVQDQLYGGGWNSEPEQSSQSVADIGLEYAQEAAVLDEIDESALSILRSRLVSGERVDGRFQADRSSQFAKNRKPQGFRSLKIRLESRQGGLQFHSLSPSPVLDISLQRQTNLQSLAFAVGGVVFAIGIWLSGSSRRARLTFVLTAVLLSTLPGVLPFMAAWIQVFNAVFVAAACLCGFYIVAGICRKLWRPFKRPVILMLAFVLGLGARGAEMVTPLPLPIPINVLVEVRSEAAEKRLLVPREHLEELREMVKPKESVEDPLLKSVSWFGGAVVAELNEDAHVEWSGLYRLRTRGEGMHVIPFPVVGAELEGVKVNGATALLRSRKGRTEVLIAGEGVHELTFVLRAKVKREASVRFVDFQIPAIPSLVAKVTAPTSGLRMEITGTQLDRALISKEPNEILEVPLEANGRVHVRWYPPANVVEGGGGLQVTSLQVMDLSLDAVTLVNDLSISPGGVPVDRIRVKIPEGWHLQQVEGEVVGGWDRGEGDQQAWVTVYFLREVEARAGIRLSLWKNRAAESGNESVPSLPVQGAVRQTGNVVLRHTDDVELKIVNTENVKRVEMPKGLPAALSITGEADPRTRQRFHSYSSHSPAYEIVIQISEPENRMEATWQALLRVAALGDVVEARCRVLLKGAAVYRMSFDIPKEMEITRVECAGVEEWSVEAGRLQLFAPKGLRSQADVVIEGRFPAGKGEKRKLPVLKLVDADTRSGQWVVLADPSVDVETVGSLEMKRIALSATYGWLSAPQRPYARLALSFANTDAAADLEITRRSPEVTVTTFTNMRINHQVIEETYLVDATVRRAGLREFQMRVPARFKDARVKAPLMREVRITPVPDQSDWVEMTVVLQDEVMGQLVILLEKDRGAERSELLLQAPKILTGRTQRVFVTVENAGRDEVRVASSAGLESLSRGHSEWQAVTDMLGENLTFAFVGEQGGADVSLGLTRIAREQAVTAGGRIGLSRVDLQLDGKGAYLGRWTAWVDNRTEQSLQTLLPEGARLVAVTVAGEEVRALRDHKGEGNRLRIPLVKTPRGEQDIQVELIYAGKLDSLSVLRRDGFPFPESLNLPVDLSQATLYLPNSQRWIRFDGSMRELDDEAQFQAGWLNYQAGLAERLAQTLKTGDVFEQARATYNLTQLQSDFEEEDKSQNLGNRYVAEERNRASAALEKAQKEMERADFDDDSIVSDNRSTLNDLFAGQSNSFSRNEVLLNPSNFEAKDQKYQHGNKSVDPSLNQGYGSMQQLLQSENIQRQNSWKSVPQDTPSKKAPSVRGGRKQQAAKYLDDLGKSPSLSQQRIAPVEALLFPQPDPSRTVVYRFTTPRGDMNVTAVSVSGNLVQSLVRAGVFLLLLLLVIVIVRSGELKIREPNRFGTWLLFLGLLALIAGIFPVAAIGVIIWGWVMKMQSKNPTPVLRRPV